MHIEDPDNTSESSVRAVPDVGELHVTTLHESDVPQRRGMLRRRVVQPVAAERRKYHRRRAQPGVDGLLRTVLSDAWKPLPRTLPRRKNA